VPQLHLVEGLMWLTGAVVCLYVAPLVQFSLAWEEQVLVKTIVFTWSIVC